MSQPHIAVMIPFHADLRVHEDEMERTAQNVHLSVADFMVLVQQAKTTERCGQIARELGSLVLCLQAVEDAALLKADDLCGM